MSDRGVELRLKPQHAAQKVLTSNRATVNGRIDRIDDVAGSISVDAISVKIVAAFSSGELLCVPYQPLICVHDLCQPPSVSLVVGQSVSVAGATLDQRHRP